MADLPVPEGEKAQYRSEGYSGSSTTKVKISQETLEKVSKKDTVNQKQSISALRIKLAPTNVIPFK